MFGWGICTTSSYSWWPQWNQFILCGVTSVTQFGIGVCVGKVAGYLESLIVIYNETWQLIEASHGIKFRGGLQY